MRGIRSGAAVALACVAIVAGCSQTTGSPSGSTTSEPPSGTATSTTSGDDGQPSGDAACTELTAWAERTASAVDAIGQGPVTSEQQTQLVSLADEARELALRTDDPYLSLLAATDASLHLIAEAAPKVDTSDIRSVTSYVAEVTTTCAAASP